MNKVLAFGEHIAEYEVPVLNEREVRASAGILFLFAMVAFMNAWMLGDFRLTRIFVIAFLVDFTIRIFINPRFAPSLIVGRFAVRNQLPEYVGAPQKRFAWAIGFVLALSMMYLIVINNVIGPINLIVCAACLTLMFFESAFGICLGCKVYNWFHKEQAQLCPGGTCDVPVRQEIQKIDLPQMLIVAAFLVMIVFVGRHMSAQTAPSTLLNAAPAAEAGSRTDCTPPDWAVAMGHAEKWKLHNNCK
ncbi:MAG: DUF4395 domain-containing protein [Sulfuritalea sp.]|nr:DUF4395 domain-containing protein [Sulfuritalea sp.]